MMETVTLTASVPPPASNSNTPTAREGRKCTKACNYCRIKKIKCNGGTRCSSCISHNNAECVYPSPQRRSRGRLFEENRILMERIARMEALLRRGGELPSPLPAHNSADSQPSTSNLEQAPPHQADDVGFGMITDMPENNLSPTRQARTPSLTITDRDVTGFGEQSQHRESANSEDCNFDSFNVPQYPISPPSISAQRNMNEEASVYGGGAATAAIHFSMDGTPRAQSRNNSGPNRNGNNNEPLTPITLSPESSTSEHHGPTSFLSICSDPGLHWVTERTGAADFTGYARALAADISRSLKLEVNRVKERAPEPDMQTAWIYCNKYFEESAEMAGGVVNRPAFEARLHAHFDRSRNEDDPAWYALRNTVYASGCRFVMSQPNDSASFRNANVHAWKYFENALSVHTDLLYSHTSLLAIEALIAMSFFVEGLGSPALEYMLCSNAARLAQSKGLHQQQPSKQYGGRETERLNRAWLFWTIYSYEKHISCRSGRPSAIDDDDISCPIPTTAPPGSSINVPFLTAIINHAQLASLISRRLATVKAYQQTPRELIQTVNFCSSRLESWANAIPSYYQLKSATIKYSALPPGMHILHVLYLRYSYYGSVLAIHTIFTNPWTSAIIRTDRSQEFIDQVQLSTHAVVEASRAMILTTKYIDVDASSPVWLAFYYPFIALLNLFLYILKNPSAPSATSDVALMDIIAGHFGRVEFLTNSEFSFPFVREVTSLANIMVKRARGKITMSDRSEEMKGDSGRGRCVLGGMVMEGAFDRMEAMTGMGMGSGLMDEPISGFRHGRNDFPNIDMAGFDLDSWGAYSQMSPMGFDVLALNADGAMNYAEDSPGSHADGDGDCI